MKENSRILKAAGVVGAATLLSRILGYIRDAVIAWYFGAGHSSDAFIAAFRIPNLLRKLFGEGAISNAFIPVLTDYLTEDGQDEGLRLARSALFVMSILLVVLSICGILLAPLIVKVVAPGFLSSPGKIPLTVTLTRIMFPYIFFIGLVALCMGILNVFGHFAAPALAPVLLNLAMICSVIFICPYLSNPVMGLAIGVIIGGILQLGLQLPFMIRKGLVLRPKGKLFHPGLKKIGVLMLPVIFGGAVYQVNVLIGGLLGSLLKEGSVSYLYFADRLVQFPLGIFAIAAATAVLPSLSRQAASNDVDALKDTFGYAVRLIIFLTIPSMVGLIILREPIVALIQFACNSVDCPGAFILCYGSRGVFGGQNRCRHLFCPKRYAHACGHGACLYSGEYCAGCYFDETAGARWTCPGNVACFDFEPRAAGAGVALKAWIPGMEKHHAICIQGLVKCRIYGGCCLGCRVCFYSASRRSGFGTAAGIDWMYSYRFDCLRYMFLFNEKS
jgi:putative peptidoglycan lipid II flippase